jgi:hypothetical protein
MQSTLIKFLIINQNCCTHCLKKNGFANFFAAVVAERKSLFLQKAFAKKLLAKLALPSGPTALFCTLR